jgi:hypothetical protein
MHDTEPCILMTAVLHLPMLCCRYADLTECMDSISLEELIMAVRRQSQGFSRGTSAFRGVTHHPSGCQTHPMAAAAVAVFQATCSTASLTGRGMT